MIRRFLADAWSRLWRGEPLDVYVGPVDPPQEILDAVSEEYVRRLVELAEPPAPPRVPLWTYSYGEDPSAVVASLPLHEDQLEIAREILRSAASGEPVRSRPRRPSACGCPECVDGDPLLETSFEATLDEVNAIEAVWLDVLAVEVDGIAADAIHPDDPPERIAALLEIRRAARRVGGLDPISDSERTGHA